LGPSFGGINLEDFKAPEAFDVESELIDKMDIPVFHDDQHGTAIVSSAALLSAVLSNGTAVLGLGNLGGLASKPVMEGKAVLFKKFAHLDSVDICIDATSVDEIVNCIK
jgi:malic enzyme